MRLPRVLVYESDGSLIRMLRASAISGSMFRTSEQTRGQWLLRRIRHVRSVQRYLKTGSPAVLVLKIGSDLTRELMLLENVHRLYPAVAAVIVADRSQEPVFRLCWDFGAWCILVDEHDRLPEVVCGSMEATITRMRALLGRADLAEAVIELDEP